MDKIQFDTENVPLINDKPVNYRLVIPFYKVAWFTIALPFFGFVFCILWSITYNFESSTSTHCMVFNFLPSISAAIGHYEPQRHVWQTAIALQAVIRAFILQMYYNYYEKNMYRWAQGVCKAALMMYAIENTSLVTLSFWTSNDNYAIHKLSFIIFLIMSFLHMCLVFYIEKTCRRTSRDTVERKSYKIKTRALTTNCISILMACYFFWRHNQYCEPFVYSLFATFEYMVVLSNMAFHLTAAWDFSRINVLLSTNGIKFV